MFKHYFEIIEGIDIYPVVSLLVFFVFFIGVAIFIIFVDKSYLKKMESLPLENEKPESNKNY